jgi:hypothetical protein
MVGVVERVEITSFFISYINLSSGDLHVLNLKLLSVKLPELDVELGDALILGAE